jgi:hypothetical protein
MTRKSGVYSTIELIFKVIFESLRGTLVIYRCIFVTSLCGFFGIIFMWDIR